ncbi:unnamed protein product, partial [Brachionus calyciflorus]
MTIITNNKIKQSQRLLADSLNNEDSPQSMNTQKLRTKRCQHEIHPSGTRRMYRSEKLDLEPPPFIQAFFTYLSYTVLSIFGHFRELLRRLKLDKRKGAVDNNTSGFVSLYLNFESFFTRNYYLRVRDVFNRPICSVPGAEIELLERKSSDYNWSYFFTGKKLKALNMGSYNYLGFAENNGPSSQSAVESITNFSVATCSSRSELGTLKCHLYLEKQIAKFLGVEACLTFGMGYATNVMNISSL